MAKKIYLVRHGESDGNSSDYYQSAETPLTPRGKLQARVIASRCAKLPIQKIVASPILRARETADIIGHHIDKTPEFSHLFAEWRRPAQQMGNPHSHPESARIEKTLQENWGMPGFRFSDEETFNELKIRAQQALQLLEDKGEDEILVVTHGIFLKMLLATSIFGANLTPQESFRFIRNFDVENTGLSVLVYDEDRSTIPWRVWVWNDHAHLG